MGNVTPLVGGALAWHAGTRVQSLTLHKLGVALLQPQHVAGSEFKVMLS